MKKSVAMLMVLVLLVAGCSSGTVSSTASAASSGAVSSAAPASKTTYKLKIGTGSSGGVFYVLGAAMADVINQKSSMLNMTAQATSATSENLAFTNSHELDFGFAVYDVAYAAYTGTRE